MVRKNFLDSFCSAVHAPDSPFSGHKRAKLQLWRHTVRLGPHPGALLTDIDQTKIRIVIGRYQKQEKLNFHHLLIMPLTRRVR